MNIIGQKEFKVYIAKDGSIRILDPDTTIMSLLKTLNPAFQVQSVPPPAGYVPNFQRMRRIYVPDVYIDQLENADTDTLWNIHGRILTGNLSPSSDKNMANMIELKEELSRRIYQSCNICPWNCGINRFITSGRCKLKDKAFFSSIFTHISEEDVINPAINVKLVGCNMDCCYCHTWENLENNPSMILLNEHIWINLNLKNAVTLEFVGGEPGVNILCILETLSFAPYSLSLPVVWNTNGYMNRQTSSLLHGVIDVFLVDLKYGNNECAFRLSGVTDYIEAVQDGIIHMIKWGVKTIVRILVLPGHIDCCHQPTIEWLAQFKDYENLWVSLLDQYVPEYKAGTVKAMNRCPAPAEIEYVGHLIEKNGLKDISKNPEGFWIHNRSLKELSR